ncbi:MAG: magnesium transporter [Chloroflexales bacterium]|nr:magnesium transporter [Chloroflexales bacterium]
MLVALDIDRAVAPWRDPYQKAFAARYTGVTSVKTIINLEELEQDICTALAEDNTDALRRLLTAQHPADIADIIDRLDDEEQLAVFRLLDPPHATDVLSETGVDATRELLQSLSADEVRALLSRMSTDDIVEILGEDAPDLQHELLAMMEPQDAQEVRTLLTYPPRTAGRLMTEEFVQAYPDMNAAEALQALRQVALEVETISNLYVLDVDKRLIGIVKLRNLLLAPPERRVMDVAQTEFITVGPETDQEEVARLVSQYDLFAAPVVDQGRKMLGIVTVDDVIDVLVQEGTEDVLRFGAVQDGATDESYFDVPIRRAIRRRVGWLLLLFLTGTLTVNVLGWFEEALAEVVALSFFIPLLIGTGGNTGAQTVSTIVRSLALGDVRFRDIGRVLLRELGSGVLLGLLLSLAAAGMALLGGNSPELAIVVALSVLAICVWANIMGALVPMLARRFGLDPALVSAPLITTLVDATGLAIYLFIAKTILGL